MGDYDALRPAERARLERFSAAFEQVDAMDYERYAGTTASDEDLEAARATAVEVMGSAQRRAAIDRAIRSFAGAADRALRGRAPVPQVLFGMAGPSIRVEDRARLMQSLERAVVAVTLWDELRDAERDALLGPWASVAHHALGWEP